jgi:Flp pilus assembly protein TadD
MRGLPHAMNLVAVASCVALQVSCTQSATRSESPSSASAQSLVMTSKSPEAIEHVFKGETLLDNLRPDEALAEFAAALKLDPDFVLARAEHGVSTPGPAGLAELERAAAAVGDVTEAERLLIEAAVQARRGGDSETVLQRLIEAAPGYSRGHRLLGSLLVSKNRFAEGVAELKKAIQVDPNNGAAYNMIGYAALRQGDADGAIRAFKEYARLLPREPNAKDSLGEALLVAGRFQEAEVAFQTAIALSPQFWSGHQGIAMARFYRGDMVGASDAWASARTAATRVGDKMSVDADIAAAIIAQSNTGKALQTLEAAAKTAGASSGQVAMNDVLRAQTYILAGRPREALGVIAMVMKVVESGELPPRPARNVAMFARRARVAAEALLKDAAAAKETTAALEKEASSHPTDVDVQDAMHFAQGELAVASGDLATARAHFARCSTGDEWCRWHGVMAAETAGDAASAAAGREALLKLYGRTQVHMIIRSRLTTHRRHEE